MCWDFLNIALKLFCKLHVWADSLLWQLTYKMLIDIHWNGVEPYFSKNGDLERAVVFKGPHLYAFLYEEECKSNLKMSAKTSVFSRQSLRVKKMSTLLLSRKTIKTFVTRFQLCWFIREGKPVPWLTHPLSEKVQQVWKKIHFKWDLLSIQWAKTCKSSILSQVCPILRFILIYSHFNFSQINQNELPKKVQYVHGNSELK